MEDRAAQVGALFGAQDSRCDLDVPNERVPFSELRNTRVLFSELRNTRVLFSELRNTRVLFSELRNTVVAICAFVEGYAADLRSRGGTAAAQ
ncbi:hypothetical protein ACUXZZ_32550 [Streptomyces graminifolii]|uniref:hypothetical protein n=1 Tax=Streptomyces graminifolii TaxID=1266771 RepID=UPI004059595D